MAKPRLKILVLAENWCGDCGNGVPVIARMAEYFSNWELSGARALTAINHLVKLGIDPKRLSAVAYGPYHPLYPNDTEENRTKNRRIEINIIREK